MAAYGTAERKEEADKHGQKADTKDPLDAAGARADSLSTALSDHLKRNKTRTKRAHEKRATSH